MLLHINGEQRDFPDDLTVAGLVAQLGIKPDRVAVELNLEIVPRTNWDATSLKDGDKLEVVHFVGGGSTDTEFIQQENQGSESVASAGWKCPTCGTLVTGKFCPDCGEKKSSSTDLSIHHFFTHALGEFFHFDSKIFRSFRFLFTRPGFLTSEYLRGCRKPYLHPFQLFFIANLIYFLLQPHMGWSGLRTTLTLQTKYMSYSNLASRMVSQRIAAKGISLEAFSHSFDHMVDVQARSLVLVIVLIYAAVLAILQWRKKAFFGQHLVFCLHFTAFWLLATFVGIYGGSYWIMRLAASQGASLPWLSSDKDLFLVALVLMALYAARALRTVYHDSLLVSLLKGAALAAALHYVLDVFRFVLFLIALYAS
jgi:thiamine biosynthesis protein ThiS